MIRQGRKLQETLEEYLCSIDNGDENLELYNELKNMSYVSEEARMLYQQARIAQTIFYEGLIAQRKRVVEESLLSEFDEIINDEPNYEDIWSYLNHLLVHSKNDWKTILYSVGMDPKFSKPFREQNMNLERVAPSILAHIGRILDAQPSLLFELSYKWFSRGIREKEALYSAVSYRVIENITNLSDSEEEPSVASYYTYLEELHNHLV